ncbi:putative Cytochrome bd2, subunit I [Rhodovastum atsumiense]|uniref:Cytochrome ubiquinol oxidase subunit I n=1 Tax=Rhodovastum atsumiense TaxID=504468 RepID=A0A5M6IRZ8_9PROT|nr:cytochrome ubiquinol oxidase subunit I [Rhodovastum atsumiense]KAA5611070.1 cytochrome ubiquinol oxidase subunit I [Rhodovastum atsumiense]CAH2599129.1 putative Cytochrome bd2, subunit I [Rhodovastum atsumiense]
MPGPEAILLARVQFAFTIAFHIILPAFSIGLASYLMVLEGLWLRTGRQVYMDLFRYWLKPFALTFAMGVVSGIVMSYEFGLNWGAFSDRAGPVIGPLMGYEVLTAFFLEAGFLGVMLFGARRVGPRLHFAATCIVALGTLISAFWILSVNSWMQTPQGHVIAPDGRFHPDDWARIIFNPSFFYRLPHMVLAGYLSVAFFVGAVGAWHLLRDRGNAGARTMFSMAMWMATLVAPLQVVVGDLHGLNTLEHQPAKVAAMEGHYETRRGAPLILFGWPDDAQERTRYAVGVPYLGSLILTHSFTGEVKGLKEWAPADRPPAPLVFWAFRVMVGLGVLMVAVGLTSLWLRRRGRLFDHPGLLRAAVAMGPAGFIALLAGWVVTEVGRQPWMVYGLMRTAESVSPIGTPGVAASLAAFAVVYLTVFGAGFLFLFRLLAHPPAPDEPGPPAGVPIRTAGITPGPAGAAPEPQAREP